MSSKSGSQQRGNEWYLFHGTNPEAAAAICASDFKVSRAGSSTGLYFAESITKAVVLYRENVSIGCDATKRRLMSMPSLMRRADTRSFCAV
eukprot:g13078.t1